MTHYSTVAENRFAVHMLLPFQKLLKPPPCLNFVICISHMLPAGIPASVTVPGAVKSITN